METQTEQPPTRGEIEEEAQRIIAQLMGEVQSAPEPGTLKPKDVLHMGDEDVPATMVAGILTSAGWCWIYDTKTAERSLTNMNMLPAQLRKRREDGSLIFTTIKPNFEPRRGTLLCPLHPKGPDRKHYDELGFGTCRKATLLSPFQVDRHMRNRHKLEWATIKQERDDAKEAHQWEVQEALLRQAISQGHVPVVAPEPTVAAAPARRRRKPATE